MGDVKRIIREKDLLMAILEELEEGKRLDKG